MVRIDDSSSQSEQNAIVGFSDYESLIGDAMRGRRASMNKSLLDVHRDIGLRPYIIHAIENGDLKAFETPSLIGGYVRQYAKFLGWDPEESYERFCRETGHAGKLGRLGSKRSLSQITPLKPTRVNSGKGWDSSGILYPRTSLVGRLRDQASLVGIGSIALVLLLLGGGGYVVWTLFKQVQQLPVAAGNLNMERSLPVEGYSNSPTLDEVISLVESSPANFSVNPNASEPTTELALIGDLVPGKVQGQFETVIAEGDTTPLFFEGIEADHGAGLVRTASESLVLEEVIDAPELAHKVVMVASKPTWVRVSEEDGTVHLEKILAAGEEYEVPDIKEKLLLRAGNSGYLYFVVGDEVFGPAGSGTRVVKNVQLSADAIRTTYSMLVMDAVPDEIQSLSRFTKANINN